MRFWDAGTGQPFGQAVHLPGENTQPGDEDQVLISFSPDGATLATLGIGGGDSKVRLWDARTHGQLDRPFESQTANAVGLIPMVR
jgi:WD40 repeat protein